MTLLYYTNRILAPFSVQTYADTVFSLRNILSNFVCSFRNSSLCMLPSFIPIPSFHPFVCLSILIDPLLCVFHSFPVIHYFVNFTRWFLYTLRTYNCYCHIIFSHTHFVCLLFSVSDILYSVWLSRSYVVINIRYQSTLCLSSCSLPFFLSPPTLIVSYFIPLWKQEHVH